MAFNLVPYDREPARAFGQGYLMPPSARAMLQRLLSGQRDPALLAELADSVIHSVTEQVHIHLASVN